MSTNDRPTETAMETTMDFAEWIESCRSYLNSRSDGLAAICGDGDDMRGYFEDGYTPQAAADELVSYAD